MRALDTLALFPQNVMVADTAGHIYYQRTGRVPRRPDGYDWSSRSTAARRRPSGRVPSGLGSPAGARSAAGLDAELQHPARRHDAGVAVPARGRQGLSVREPRVRGALGVDQPARRARRRAARGRRLGHGRRGDGVHQRTRAVRRGALDRGAARRRHGGGEGARRCPRYRAGLDALTSWDGRLAPDSRGALVYDYWRRAALRRARGRRTSCASSPPASTTGTRW